MLALFSCTINKFLYTWYICIHYSNLLSWYRNYYHVQCTRWKMSDFLDMRWWWVGTRYKHVGVGGGASLLMPLLCLTSIISDAPSVQHTSINAQNMSGLLVLVVYLLSIFAFLIFLINTIMSLLKMCDMLFRWMKRFQGS